MEGDTEQFVTSERTQTDKGPITMPLIDHAPCQGHILLADWLACMTPQKVRSLLAKEVKDGLLLFITITVGTHKQYFFLNSFKQQGAS